MDDSLASRITQNSFVSTLLEHRVDRAAFTDLCQALHELAQRWNGKDHVEKILALELYITASVMRNEILGLREHGSNAEADELAAMFLEIDRLITEEWLIET